MHIVIKFLTTSKFYITSKNQRPVTSPSGKVGGARLMRFMVITLSKCKQKLRGLDELVESFIRWCSTNPRVEFVPPGSLSSPELGSNLLPVLFDK